MDKKYSLILLIIIALTITPIAIALSDYSYQVAVVIENNGDTEMTSRSLLQVNAEALVDGGYIQVDGGDIALTEIDETTELEITACSLDSETAVWILDYDTLAPHSLSNKYVWLGNSSANRNQKWIAGSADNCYTEHDASLSFNSGSSFAINCDITLSGTPIGECYIVGKSGSYELLVDDTPFPVTICRFMPAADL